MRFLVLLLASLATGCVGSCGSDSKRLETLDSGLTGRPPGPPITVAPALSPDTGLLSRKRPPFHSGFVGLVLRSGREADLAPEQKIAVGDIQQRLEDEEPPLSTLNDFRADLVSGIRAGKLDEKKLQDDYAAIDQNLLLQQKAQADAIDALHAALDATARGLLVAAARLRLEAMFRARPELADAGGLVEQARVNHQLGRVKVELGLDEAQAEKVKPMLAKSGVSPAVGEALKARVRAHAEEMLAAFEKDPLDAHALDLSPAGGKSPPHASLERETKFIGQVLPLLTPEQRERLAVMRQRRALGRWTADIEPWSPFDESMELPGGPR